VLKKQTRFDKAAEDMPYQIFWHIWGIFYHYFRRIPIVQNMPFVEWLIKGIVEFTSGIVLLVQAVPSLPHHQPVTLVLNEVSVSYLPIGML
jgi:hypothetical protein